MFLQKLINFTDIKFFEINISVSCLIVPTEKLIIVEKF